MIYVGVLTYQRSRTARRSLQSLANALNSEKRDYKVVIFDDGSSEKCYREIKEACKKFFPKNVVYFQRENKNTGYNKNLIRVFKYFASLNVSADDTFYVHESDIVLSSKWFRDLETIDLNKTGCVVTPLHHVDTFCRVLDYSRMTQILLNLGLKIQRNHDKTTYYKSFKLVPSYSTVGTFAFGQNFLNVLVQNITNFHDFNTKEDAYISYLAQPSLRYISPGRAKFYGEIGLNGDMTYNTLSFERTNIKIYCTSIFIFIKRKLKSIFKIYFFGARID